MSENGNKPRVLVVDDEVQMTTLYEYGLQRDFEVVVANSVAQALRLLETTEFDAAVFDYDMDDGTGADLYLRYLQILSSEASIIPIVFVTARTPETTRQLQEAISQGKVQGGQVEYLQKPVRVRQELATVLQRIVVSKNGGDATASSSGV